MRAVAHGRAALALLAALAGGSLAGEEAPKERVVDLGGGVKMAFVALPPGAFTRRPTGFKDRDKPAHKVTISRAFWMGKHEVTVGQFRRFVEGTGYKTDAEKGTPPKGAFVVVDGKGKRPEDANWRNPYFKQTDEHPVVCVSWHDARAFADWLNAADNTKPAGSTYRLPTEAEWEYACQAGTTTGDQGGTDPDGGKGRSGAADLTEKKTLPERTVLNRDAGFPHTAPVGSSKANAFGLYDMYGNVSEWCQDWHGDYREGDQTDPSGPANGVFRVQRGGSWYMRPRGVPPPRVPRGTAPPVARTNTAGFRLALAPGP